MGTNYTKSTITSGFASTTNINNERENIEDALERSLSRYGDTPNQMEAEIDMNSQKITNLGAPENDNDAVRRQDVTIGGDPATASIITIDDAGNYYDSTSVETALQEIWDDLGDTANGEGASRVSIEDADGHFTATTVEAALDEIKTEGTPWVFKQSATYSDADSFTTDTTTTDDAGEYVWHRTRIVRGYHPISNVWRYAKISGTGPRGISGQVNLVNIVDSAGSNASLLNESLTVWVGPASYDSPIPWPWASLRAANNNLPGLVAAIGSEDATIAIDTDVTISSNLTIPSNIDLLFLGRSQIIGSTNPTLTINGDIIAGGHQIFGADLTVDVSSNERVFDANAFWFNGTDIGAKINSGWGFGFKRISVPKGTHSYSTKISVPVGDNNVYYLLGSGVQYTTLDYTATDGSDAMEAIGTGSAPNVAHLIASDFKLTGNASSGDGLVLDRVNNLTRIENLHIEGFTNTGASGLNIKSDISNGYNNILLVKNCLIQLNDIGLTCTDMNVFQVENGSISSNNDRNVVLEDPNGVSFWGVTMQGNPASNNILIQANGRDILNLSFNGCYIETSGTGTSVRVDANSGNVIRAAFNDLSTGIGSTTTDMFQSSGDVKLSFSNTYFNGNGASTFIFRGATGASDTFFVTTDENCVFNNVSDITIGDVFWESLEAHVFKNIADDAAVSFTPLKTEGKVEILASAGLSFAGNALYRAEAVDETYIVGAGGADFEVSVTGGALNGTTGTDGKVTVSANTDNQIYIENRSGGTSTFHVKVR